MISSAWKIKSLFGISVVDGMLIATNIDKLNNLDNQMIKQMCHNIYYFIEKMNFEFFNKCITFNDLINLKKCFVNICAILNENKRIYENIINEVFQIFKICNPILRNMINILTNTFKDQEELIDVVFLSDILKYLDALNQLSDQDVGQIKLYIIQIFQLDEKNRDDCIKYIKKICTILVTKVWPSVIKINTNTECDDEIYKKVNGFFEKMNLLINPDKDDIAKSQLLTKKIIQLIQNICNVVMDFIDYLNINENALDVSWFMKKFRNDNAGFDDALIYYEYLKKINEKFSMLSKMDKCKKFSDCIHVITKNKDLCIEFIKVFHTNVMCFQRDDNEVMYFFDLGDIKTRQYIDHVKLISQNGLYYNKNCIIERKYDFLIVKRHREFLDYAVPVHHVMNTTELNIEECTVRMEDKIIKIYNQHILLCSVNCDTGLITVCANLQINTKKEVLHLTVNDAEYFEQQYLKLCVKNYSNIEKLIKHKFSKQDKFVTKWKEYVKESIMIKKMEDIQNWEVGYIKIDTKHLWSSCPVFQNFSSSHCRNLSEQVGQLLNNEIYYKMITDKSVVVFKDEVKFTVLRFDEDDNEIDVCFFDSYHDAVEDINEYMIETIENSSISDDEMDENFESDEEDPKNYQIKHIFADIKESLQGLSHIESSSESEINEVLKSDHTDQNNDKNHGKNKNDVKKVGDHFTAVKIGFAILLCIIVCVILLSLEVIVLNNDNDYDNDNNEVTRQNVFNDSAEVINIEHSNIDLKISE